MFNNQSNFTGFFKVVVRKISANFLPVSQRGEALSAHSSWEFAPVTANPCLQCKMACECRYRIQCLHYNIRKYQSESYLWCKQKSFSGSKVDASTVREVFEEVLGGMIFCKNFEASRGLEVHFS